MSGTKQTFYDPCGCGGEVIAGHSRDCLWYGDVSDPVIDLRGQLREIRTAERAGDLAFRYSETIAFVGVVEAALAQLTEDRRARDEAVWDHCLDEIEKHEINTAQAREGNPYRPLEEAQR